MRAWRRLLTLAGALALASLTGCVGVMVFVSVAPGAPMDVATMARIRPGTTLAEVLSWLGPPDYIVDGTQQLVDFTRLNLTRLPLATRVLSAPEGTVILVYAQGGGTFKQASVVSVVAKDQRVDVREERQLGDELFVYVAKASRTVVTVGGWGAQR